MSQCASWAGALSLSPLHQAVMTTMVCRVRGPFVDGSVVHVPVFADRRSTDDSSAAVGQMSLQPAVRHEAHALGCRL